MCVSSVRTTYAGGVDNSALELEQKDGVFRARKLWTIRLCERKDLTKCRIDQSFVPEMFRVAAARLNAVPAALAARRNDATPVWCEQETVQLPRYCPMALPNSPAPPHGPLQACQRTPVHFIGTKCLFRVRRPVHFRQQIVRPSARIPRCGSGRSRQKGSTLRVSRYSV